MYLPSTAIVFSIRRPIFFFVALESKNDLGSTAETSLSVCMVKRHTVGRLKTKEVMETRTYLLRDGVYIKLPVLRLIQIIFVLYILSYLDGKFDISLES